MKNRNILLTIAYDGTGFSGWQRQPQQRTVQGEIERVLGVLCGQTISINGTSRTDAGVHALGQRASFSGQFGIPTERLQTAMNHLLAAGGGSMQPVGDIRVTDVQEMPEDFHARFSAVGKMYIYRLRVTSEPDPFLRHYCYQIQRNLDADAMRRGAAAFVGTKDFRSLMAAGGKEMEDTVRTIHGLAIADEPCPGGRELQIKVVGNGFLYNMVRIITGTLVDVGLGRIAPERIPGILAGLDRSLAGHTAPPQGLYLAEIYYDTKKMLQQAEAI